MAPLAFLLVAASLTGPTCRVLTYRAERTAAPADAIVGLERFLKKLPGEVNFVSERNGVFRFWPKGVYGGITYDGTLCTDLTLDHQRAIVSVSTLIYTQKTWKATGTQQFGAVELLARLARNDGTALGIPVSLRRDMSKSSLHRRVMCGISLGESPTSHPEQK